jgi:phenylalanyl-tRNA synthetase beta chain
VRLPLSWLADHVAHELTADVLALRLAASGTNVEEVIEHRVSDADGNLANFRVGRVIEAVKHPDADRLRVCQVDTSDGEPRQIVCGAANVVTGLTVAVALPGALLPGAQEPLRVVKLRGVESQGMICSARELGLGQDHAGIMELQDGLTPGAPLADALPISETVIDLEITSNRPDCLSITGLAREVAAFTQTRYCPPVDAEPPADGPGSVGDYVALRVDAPDLCPRYMARVLVDVEVGPSPIWLAARLEAAGMRSISNVVDVTNYVMLLTGQPLHAFDLDKLAGPEIVVRRAAAGEPITTLDDVQRTLDPDVLAICDADRPMVIAGIMGAADCEVSDTTRRIMLEAATFDGPNILRTSLRLGLRSESSSRFEKRLPTELPPRAMAIACRMLIETCGAVLVPGTLDACEPIPQRPPVVLRHGRAETILGVPVAPERSVEILTRLGFGVEELPDGLRVQVPFERAGDVTREIDLIEEVARIEGFDQIPAVLPRTAVAGGRSPAQALREKLADRLVTRGVSEIISYRFVPEADADRLQMSAEDPRRNVVRLAKPMSEEMAVMRRSMLPGLLRAAAHNQAHQRPSGGLFEIGRTYAPREDGLADEREFVAVLRFGPPSAEHWRATPGTLDIHSGIGLFADLTSVVGVSVHPEANDAPYFHPARQARMRSGQEIMGWVGEMHPLVLRNFDVRGPVVAVVIPLDALLAAAVTGARLYQPILNVPVSTRDIAVVVADTVTSEQVLGVARRAGGALVRVARIFDRYVGARIGAGRVSLALRLEIADPERTLTDAEIEAPVAAVVAALVGELGAELRGGS